MWRYGAPAAGVLVTFGVRVLAALRGIGARRRPALGVRTARVQRRTQDHHDLARDCGRVRALRATREDGREPPSLILVVGLDRAESLPRDPHDQCRDRKTDERVGDLDAHGDS
jgi:hypothetical protein